MTLSHGTLVCRSTPVENHCSRDCQYLFVIAITLMIYGRAKFLFVLHFYVDL